MSELSMRLEKWEARRTVEEEERARVQFLNGPLPKNPPELFDPIKVKVLKRFFIKNRLAEVDSVVTIERNLAESLQGIGKARILD